MSARPSPLKSATARMTEPVAGGEIVAVGPYEAPAMSHTPPCPAGPLQLRSLRPSPSKSARRGAVLIIAGTTIIDCATGVDVLDAKPPVPVSCAVSDNEPAGRPVALQVACPAADTATAAQPLTVVPLYLKATVPVGTP